MDNEVKVTKPVAILFAMILIGFAALSTGLLINSLQTYQEVEANHGLNETELDRNATALTHELKEVYYDNETKTCNTTEPNRSEVRACTN